jgi:nucleotide-binding universal stress UspA family protein
MEDFQAYSLPRRTHRNFTQGSALCGDHGQTTGCQVHLLHVLRRFDWFVDTYVSDPPKPDFKRIASDFESQVLSQANKTQMRFIKKYLSDIRIANTRWFPEPITSKFYSYVESEGIDLIIMGTGTPIQKVMFGSVAEKVSGWPLSPSCWSKAPEKNAIQRTPSIKGGKSWKPNGKSAILISGRHCCRSWD